MALQYITNHLLPALEEANNGTFARVQKYITENSVEDFDPSNCPSPSPSPSLTSSSLCDCYNCRNNYPDDEEEGSYTSSTHFDLSVSQLSITSRTSSPNTSPSTLNSDEEENEDEFKESPPSPPSNLLVIPSELKKYMDRYPDVSNLVQNSINLITTECTDLEKYIKSDFGIFGVMKEVLSSSPKHSKMLSDQNLEMIFEMTEILKEKITEMESATENLTNTQETFQNILETLNSSSS